jgi:KAP family P-loop domain
MLLCRPRACGNPRLHLPPTPRNFNKTIGDMNLNPPPFEIDKEDPFAHDKIGRQPLADRITRVLEQSGDAMVLAIDGGWGTGKSTFARMLKAHLEGRAFKTTYIDAFAVDYVEDAFIPILARLQTLIQDEKDILDKSEDFLKKAARVTSVLLGKLGSAAVNMSVQAIMLSMTGTPMPGLEKIGEKASEVWDELAARRINAFLQEEKSIQDYKLALAAIALAYYEKWKKPLVILIDELDRCRPDFAVQFLERIKHFFEVPHLAFILIINREQLEKTIRGCYGADLDAHTYLQKFITVNFHIDPIDPPKSNDFFSEILRKRHRYIKELLKDFGLVDSDHLNQIIMLLDEFNLSLREVEKIGGVLSASGSADLIARKPFLPFAGWIILVILKIKNGPLYLEIMRANGFYVTFPWEEKVKLMMRNPVFWEHSKTNKIIKSINSSNQEFKDWGSFWYWIRETMEPQTPYQDPHYKGG